MSENSGPVPADDLPAAEEPGAAPPANTGGAFPIPLPRVRMTRSPSSGSGLGRRVLLLNARRVIMEGATRELILLAFEDVTGTAREAAP